MTTALVYEERCLAHDNGSMLVDPQAAEWLRVGHAEGPERLARTLQLLERSGVAQHLHRLPARPASAEELALVHSAPYIESIREACERGEHLVVGPAARVGPDSWEPALLSAGGGLAAVEWVLAEPARRAYVLTRPPGHHASAEQAMGFCLFNNVALAARRAQQLGAERVAIVDWDVHHGNSTEDVFAPDLILVSAGQDAAASDPLGRMSVTAEGFRAMTRALTELADTHCEGRLTALQEGGYSTDHMPFCTLAIVEQLAGLDPSFPTDPMELDVPG